ncbi:hypothetical protein FB451DRAFT_1434724 [Mycena latifolia]|nr:hypothetical protein FB451DRAFT_1434724 [Mycena latifolia]
MTWKWPFDSFSGYMNRRAAAHSSFVPHPPLAHSLLTLLSAPFTLCSHTTVRGLNYTNDSRTFAPIADQTIALRCHAHDQSYVLNRNQPDSLDDLLQEYSPPLTKFAHRPSLRSPPSTHARNRPPFPPYAITIPSASPIFALEAKTMTVPFPLVPSFLVLHLSVSRASRQPLSATVATPHTIAAFTSILILFIWLALLGPFNAARSRTAATCLSRAQDTETTTLRFRFLTSLPLSRATASRPA